jgi:uncharacterized surface protein with fasciclin (FAS1) repeats
LKEKAMNSRARSTRHVLAALGTAMLLLQACSDGATDEAGEKAEVSDETLASLVADAGDLSIVSDTLGDAGLSHVFDGVAAYTLFAPRDSAFEALGEAGEELRSPEQRAAMVAVLRDHIVPGYLTPDDIGRAIAQADDGTVEMRTMGNHTLTFSSAGETITVTAEDGASARIAGDALRASNGVAVPLDGILKRIGETPRG